MSDHTSAEPVPGYLVPVVSDRGLTYLPPIETDHGGSVRVYESSAAEHPAIWLRLENPDHPGPTEMTAHVPIERARELLDQLQYLIENHYQTR